MKEFASAYIERVQRQSANKGAAYQAGAAKMKARLQHLVMQTKRAKPEEQQTVSKLVLRYAPGWVRMMDELLDAYDEAESLYQLSPREIRRRHADWMKSLTTANKDTEQMKTMMIDLLELFDPTPEDYLEQEARRIHGDDADRILQTFSHIAESDAFTLDAFKKRHNLR